MYLRAMCAIVVLASGTNSSWGSEPEARPETASPAPVVAEIKEEAAETQTDSEENQADDQSSEESQNLLLKEGDESEEHPLHFFADYDDGFVLRPFDSEKHPYELKVNGRIQFRHIGFARDVESWTNNAGVTRPIFNRNNWDIERARLIFSGFAVDERLTYYMQLDGDTDDNDNVEFLDFWFAWKLGDRFRLQMGKRKVPAVRQWILSSSDTRFVDRPMACDFFRPDRTVGIFGIGNFTDLDRYELMIGNGYRTANLSPEFLDDQFTYAATHYWDPFGEFGETLVDYEDSSNLRTRIGHSFVYSPQDGLAAGIPVGEADYVRLTDGTRITDIGALAPGVTVSSFAVTLYGIDLAAKWRGWSFDAEAFVRWINKLEADGALPVNELFQRGFYVEGGKFLIPKKLDVNLRYSLVDGEYGHGATYAAGFNWWPLKSPKVKITFDVTQVDSSPLNNSSSDILVGDDGTLFRTQFQAEF